MTKHVTVCQQKELSQPKYELGKNQPVYSHSVIRKGIQLVKFNNY